MFSSEDSTRNSLTKTEKTNIGRLFAKVAHTTSSMERTAGSNERDVLSVTQDSLTTTSLRSCTMTYTGSMWQIESDINWVSSAWQGSLRGTSSTVAQRSGNVSGQPHINRWWCHDTGCPLLVAEHSLCRV